MKKTLLLGTALALALSFSAFAKPSGTLTVADISDFSTLNPIVSEDASETNVTQGIFDNLFRLDNKANLVPCLATEVPTVKNGLMSKDGMTFTLKLRKGVKWHDGKPFTAKDVKFTYDAIMNEDLPLPSRDPIDKIGKFEILDDYTIRMTLKEFVPNFMVVGWSNPGIIPAHYFEGLSGKALVEALGKGGKFSKDPIGTGAFKLGEWKAGSYLVLEANENWWGGEPGLAKIVHKMLPDTNTQLTQLRTGEVDFVQLQASQYNEAKKIDRVKVTVEERAAYLHMTFNLKNEILANKDVRQALAYALPRQDIVDNVLEGLGSVSYSSISPVSWAYNKKLEKNYPYKPSMANFLLDKAGWKMGSDGFRYKKGKKLTFSLMTNAGNKTRESIAQIAQQYWKTVGVDLKLNIMEWNAMNDKVDAFDFDINMSAWITGSDPDPYSLFHSKQIPTKANNLEGQNYAQYVNKQVDKLSEQAKSTADQTKRKGYLDKVQDIVIKDLPMLYIYNYKQPYAFPKNLENFKPAPFTNGPMWNIYEWKLK